MLNGELANTIFLFLVWADQDSNPQSISLDVRSMVTNIQWMMCQYLNYFKKLNNSKTAKIWKFIVSNTICYSNEISVDYRIWFSIKIHNLHVHNSCTYNYYKDRVLHFLWTSHHIKFLNLTISIIQYNVHNIRTLFT